MGLTGQLHAPVALPGMFIIIIIIIIIIIMVSIFIDSFTIIFMNS
jgi:hypothetical protein